MCRACKKSFKHVPVFLHFHKGTVHNSLQKAGLSSRCMIFSKKKCSRYSSLFGKYISQVSVALSCTKCIDSLQVCYFFPHITVWGFCFSLGSRRSAALLRPPPPRRTHHYSSLTHSSLTHSLPHSLTHSLLTHSLTHSLTPLPHSLTHSLTEELRSPLEELRRAWAPLARGWLSCGRCNTESFLAAFRVASAVHRASWRRREIHFGRSAHILRKILFSRGVF